MPTAASCCIQPQTAEIFAVPLPGLQVHWLTRVAMGGVTMKALPGQRMQGDMLPPAEKVPLGQGKQPVSSTVRVPVPGLQPGRRQ